MEGREGMSMSGSSSYYIQRPLPSPSTSVPTRPAANLSGGSAFRMESSSNIGSQGSGVSLVEPMKKKRGRPRKYGPEGAMVLGLSSLSSAGAGSGPGSSGLVSMAGSGSPPSTQKRGRGRPPGTGRKQQLASCGEWISSSAGTGFTPHVITVAAGEDIASKIMTFSQQGPRSICILSACGVVSRVTLRQPGSSGGSVTYEGPFEILSLSGSFLLTDEGGSHGRSGALAISLSRTDSRVIGGSVVGSLIAASPAQVIVGSFIYGTAKAKMGKPKSQESNDRDQAEHRGSESQLGPPALGPGPGRSPLLAGWHVPRPTDMRNSIIASQADIDLTRG